MQLLKLPASKTRDIVILFFLVFIVLLFRRYDAFTNPQIWAEDCLIFFKQVEEKGIGSLFIPYSGYLLVMQRLIVIFFHYLSVSYYNIPAFYNLTAFLVTFFVAWGMYESAAYLNLKHKLVYATWFLFMPVAPDLMMIMGASGWLANLYMLNYIFVGNPMKNNKMYIVHTTIILILSLTQPFSFFFSPAVLLMLFLERKEMTIKKALPYLIILMGGAVQFIHIYFIDTGFYRGVPVPPEHNHFLRLFTSNVSQLFFFRSGVLPVISETLERKIAAAIFIALIGVFVVLYRKAQARRKYVLIISALICFAAFVKTYWPNESMLVALDNSRYYMIPFAAIGWISIIALDDKLNTFHICTYIAFFLLHSRQVKYALPDKEWKKQLNEFYDHKRDVIDINPEGWKYGPDRNIIRKTPN
jgi:hypothetical protein